MATSLPRRLTVLDAMVLVAATAVGLAWTRLTFHEWNELLPETGIIDESTTVQALWHWSDLAVPCLTSWSVGLSLLWLRRPRVAAGRLLRMPGAVACAAVMASLVSTLLFSAAFYVSLSAHPTTCGWFQRFPDWLYDLEDSFSRYARPNAHAVAVCWLILLFSRRWRAQPTWLDRTGRVVGLLWLIAGVPHYMFSLAVGLP